MNPYVRADLTHFIGNLVIAFQPIAKAEDINLSFSQSTKSWFAVFRPDLLTADLALILSKVIEFTPEQERIQVTLAAANKEKCHIIIRNTGINLERNKEITNQCRLPVMVTGTSKETRFVLEIDMYEEPSHAAPDTSRISTANYIPAYYKEIRDRLRSHFTKTENLVATLSKSNPREAAFIEKVNTLIISNLENNQFDTNFLSEAMNMSRTQLFRRLKPIIRQSPGSYIRTIKLQKAKELFETTDMRISEVAYRTGFETASHFTKVFTKQYGVKPSLFCQKKANATNE